MADKKKGIVVRVGKDSYFGFVRDEDGTEAYVKKTDYKPSVTEVHVGDELEYHTESGPKGLRATDVVCAKRADPTTSTNPSPPASHSPTTVPTKISVEPEFGEEYATERREGRKRFVFWHLPVWIKLTENGQPVVNKEVKLDYNDKPAQQLAESAFTLADGKAFLTVLIPQTDEYCHFAAIIDGKPYGFLWEKKAEGAKRKAKEDEAVKVKVTAVPEVESKKTIEVPHPPRDPDPLTGLFLVTVVTRLDGKPADVKFTAISEPVPVEIRQKQATGIVAVTNFTSSSPGYFELHIHFDGNYAKVIFQLEDGTEAIAWLKK